MKKGRYPPLTGTTPTSYQEGIPTHPYLAPLKESMNRYQLLRGTTPSSYQDGIPTHPYPATLKESMNS